MTEKEHRLEDLLTSIWADAKSARFVLDDMLLNDLEDIQDRIYMGQVFCDRMIETIRQATEVLIAKE